MSYSFIIFVLLSRNICKIPKDIKQLFEFEFEVAWAQSSLMKRNRIVSNLKMMMDKAEPSVQSK